MPRIFVSIASYCDEECEYTIADLFAKAQHPERISVGICWQYQPQTQPSMCALPTVYSRQVRQYSFHYSESKGAGWARHLAQQLVDGEDFILQIDAHMRFVEDWDTLLLQQYKQAPTSPCVLTAFCPNYSPNTPLNNNASLLRIAVVNPNHAVDIPQMIHLGYQKLPNPPNRPFLSGGLVFNFVFAETRTFQQVPIDPHLYFKGAEITQAARFWTHGYDIYQPNCIIAYHRWQVPVSPYKKLAGHQVERTTNRVLHLLGICASGDAQALLEIDGYGIGNRRSLADYLNFLGLDIQHMQIAIHARKGNWDKYFQV